MQHHCCLAYALSYTSPSHPWQSICASLQQCPIQDDSDDSDRDSKRTSPRHSWYTANRKRGGHASDVTHSSPLARAAALARAREAGIIAAQLGKTAIGKESVAVASTASRGGRRRLPNAVTARCHRSPSYVRTEEKPEEGSSSFRQLLVGHGVATGDSPTPRARGIAPAAAEQQRTVTEGVAEDEKTANSAQSATAKDITPAPGQSKRGEGDRQQLVGKPRKGGVSARHHRSPSMTRQTSSTLADAGAATPAAANSGAPVISSPPSIITTGHKAAGKRAAMSEKRKTAAATASPSELSPEQNIDRGVAVSPSSLDGSTSDRLRTEKQRSGFVSMATASGQTRLSKNTNGEATATNAADVVVVTNVANAAGPETEAVGTVSPSPALQEPASVSASQGRRNGHGQKIQRRAETHASLLSFSSDKYNNIGNNSDDVLPRRGPDAEGSGIASFIQNYTPFVRQSDTRRTLSEGVLRKTTIARPKEPPPLSEPLPPPPIGNTSPISREAAVGERRPTVGPVNPRAMYGHVPPPQPAGKQIGVRRPSSVSLPIVPPRTLNDGLVGRDAVARGDAKQRGRSGGGDSTSSMSTMPAKSRRNEGSKTGSGSVDAGNSSSNLLSKRSQRGFIVEKIQVKSRDEARAGSHQASLGDKEKQEKGSTVAADGEAIDVGGIGDSATESLMASRTVTENSAAALAPAETDNQVVRMSSSDKGGVGEDADDAPETPKNLPWEQQLRVMAGVGLSPGASTAQPRDQNDTRTGSSSREGTGPGEGTERGGGDCGFGDSLGKKVRMQTAIEKCGTVLYCLIGWTHVVEATKGFLSHLTKRI